MARLKTFLLALITLGCALGIGFVMQNGAGPGRADLATSVVDPDSIVHTSSVAPVQRQAPRGADKVIPAVASAGDGRSAGIVFAALQRASLEGPRGPDKRHIFECGMYLTAQPRPGAMVALALSAPCHGATRVTFHHDGMMFTGMTDPDGALDVEVPALSEKALFAATFASGDRVTAQADVPAMPFYDRIVLQWKGRTGLQLHAREFGAPYFSEGHVWAASAGDLGRSALGEGGFMTLLGDPHAPAPMLAEVYSFPVGTARRDGTVAVTIEAEVNADNCGREIAAQTIERNEQRPLRLRELTLDMPGCDDANGFLVLKNLVENLKIAAR